jgi:hypothetical protein
MTQRVPGVAQRHTGGRTIEQGRKWEKGSAMKWNGKMQDDKGEYVQVKNKCKETNVVQGREMEEDNVVARLDLLGFDCCHNPNMIIEQEQCN